MFRDREELPTSAYLGEQIQAALQASAALIVICSPRAATSRWVNEEILAFKRLGRGDRILCLIIDGEPNATSKPGRATEECFPEAVRFSLGPDGNLSDAPAEPIAADMRPIGDGQRDAFLKLAAGLAGVGFDELRQRELQRQVRRAIAAAAVSLVLVAVTGGLTVAAMWARREAVLQRTIAETERDRAEGNFREARDAVDRFYRKVADEDLLKAEGLQPLRSDLLRQALEYYRKFLDQRASDPAFAADVAAVQGSVASILAETGDPSDAVASAVKAARAFEILLESDPGSASLTEHLSESLAVEAEALDRLERTEEALERQKRAVSLLDSLPKESASWTAPQMARLWSNRGAFEARLGRLEDAVGSYERSLEISGTDEPAELAPFGFSLNAGDPGVVVVGITSGSPADVGGIQVGDKLESIAGHHIRTVEDVSTARSALVAGTTIRVEVVRGGQRLSLDVMPVRLGNFMTATTNYNLGYLLLERLHDPARARPWLERAVDEFRRTLLRRSSTTPAVRHGLALAAGVLGTCGLQLDDAELFERCSREAAKAAEENVRANPEVPAYRSLAGVNLTNLSSFLLRQERLDEASRACESAVGHFQRAIELTGGQLEDRMHLVQAISNLAMMRGQQDGPEAALPIYQSAIDTAASIPDGGGTQIIVYRARLCRNFASSLRQATRLDDAARQYAAADDLYARALSESDGGAGTGGPDALREEATQMMPWRAAVEARRDDAASLSRVSKAFEATCHALAATEPGRAAAVRLRAVAVEAWCDAARTAAAAEGQRFLALAREQVRLAEDLAAGDEPLVAAVSAMQSTVEHANQRETAQRGNGEPAGSP